MTARSYVVSLPMPSYRLSPNGGGIFWAERRRLTDAARMLARVHGLNVRGGGPTLQAPVDMHVLFSFKTNRRRDPDNLVARLKPLIDGLVDAKLIADDNAKVLRILPPEVYVGGGSGVLIRLVERK